MSEPEELEPIGESLASLIAEGGAMQPMPADAKARVLASVTRAIAAPPSPSPSPVAGSAIGKITAAAIAGVIAGGAAGVWIGRSTVEPQVVRVEVPVPVAAAEQPPIPPAIDAGPSAPIPSPPEPVHRAPRETETIDLEEERTLI